MDQSIESDRILGERALESRANLPTMPAVPGNSEIHIGPLSRCAHYIMFDLHAQYHYSLPVVLNHAVWRYRSFN